MATAPSGPLAGLRVLELGGIGPGPFCGMILADLGAEVVRVDRTAEAGRPAFNPVLQRGRLSVTLDLKVPAGAATALRLVDTADALIEGFRPGVAERLGLGPDECLARNPRLVYGRMTGWGQHGPLAQAPGHDINYIALSGALHAIGPAEGDPAVPLNLIGDMGGGGLLLALGIAAGLVHARTSGHGQVVDAAMVDGSALQLSLVQGMMAQGQWTDRRGANLLDGTAPFYRTYRCADGSHMAVGCIEPQFFAEFLDALGLSADPLFAKQSDTSAWPGMTDRLTEIFARRTRSEWTEVFAGRDACTTPVLDFAEAAAHPHNVARGTYTTQGGSPVPSPAPRFLGTPSATAGPAPHNGAHTDEVLRAAGLSSDELTALRSQGIIA
ncbi:CaiB/BaiF CoA transferase family protein [Streptomyces muensis]|uniref:CoA transferase n=1 Tax=Streptomyces muensis TaxID=1077944 RepID=A0A9X1TJI3_STRM4|nr:CaiB/BaiF CoA-transferase family protein [Streptomyces muensis]MCF1592599.1 CoA transferase [Streptomyces muensis]